MLKTHLFSSVNDAFEYLAQNHNTIKDTNPEELIIVENTEQKNYVAVFDNIDSYIGTKFRFSGYVYRLLDFSENQFVLARDMIISSDNQSLVVGFLCTSENAINFENDTWVEITGEITKGDYHGDIALVKVLEIKETEEPKDLYVYPPSDTYVPTSNIF